MKSIIHSLIRCSFSIQKFNINKNYYQALKLPQYASEKEIKKAFIELAKKYHPDTNSNKQHLFKQINEAYQILSDAQLKKEYDAMRKHQLSENLRNQQYQQNNQYYNPDPQTRAEFREQLRKAHQKMMHQYTKNRSNYDDYGQSHQNYDKFREEMIKKKKEQKYQSKATTQSVRKMEQEHILRMRDRDMQNLRKRRQQIRQNLKNKIDDNHQQIEQIVQSWKKFANSVKNIFNKK